MAVGGQGTNSSRYSLQVGGIDYTLWVDVTSTFWTESGAEVPAQFECVIASGEVSTKTITAGYDFTGQEVLLQDLTSARKLWGGIVMSAQLTHGAGPVVYYHLRAVSYDAVLDRQSITRWRSAVSTGSTVRWMATDREMVQSVTSQYGYDLGHAATSGGVTLIASTNSAMPKVTLKSVTLRDALSAIADAASSTADQTLRRFYVDFDKNLHYFKTSEGTSAPYKIGDALYDGTYIIPDYIEYEKDVNDTAYKVYVKGSNTNGTDWIVRGSTGGRRFYDKYDIIDAPESDNTPECAAIGTAYLNREAAPVMGGKFTITGKDGWRAGQTVTIRDAAFGINTTYQIREISANPNFGSGVTTYDIAFGALPWRGTDMLPRKKRSSAAVGRGSSGGGGGADSGTGSDGTSGGGTFNGCFVAGTMVLTPDGEKAIEDVTLGDAVLTLNGIGRVSELRNRAANRTPRVAVTLEDGRKIEATEGHPFWSGLEWKPIGECSPGDLVFDATLGAHVRIEAMAWLGNDPTDVFNFEVEPHHSYLVAGGIVVHNVTNLP